MTSSHQPPSSPTLIPARSKHKPVHKINNASADLCHGFLLPSPLTMSICGNPCGKSQRSISCTSRTVFVFCIKHRVEFGAAASSLCLIEHSFQAALFSFQI